jgi:nitrogen fixation NifU-like protein
MDDLGDLYQEVILDHNRRPRNKRPLPEASGEAHGHNALCGDRLVVRVRVEDGIIVDVAFEGSGCAISTAAASLMTDAVKGLTIEKADLLFRTFHQAVTGRQDPCEVVGTLGKLAAFTGVAEFPIRVKCATLPWHTLHAAMRGSDGEITTE